MSEKVSLEKLLPVALELFKTAPPQAVQLKANSPEEKTAKAIELADSFATFALHLQQKLNREA